MSETVNKNIGHATAYGYAKSKGYTGTEEQFAELMASYADVGQTAVDAALAAKASEDAAKASETASAASQTAAATSAGTASTAAQNAAQSAQAAQADADAAALDASQALSAASTAGQKATEAAQSATAAAGSATTAGTAATAAQTAQTAAETAQGKAEDAQAAAEAAAQTLVIDPTLTQANQAAEAKATGDAVSLVKSHLEVISGNTIGSFQPGYFDVPADGNTMSTTRIASPAAVSAIIAVSPGDVVHFQTNGGGSSSGGARGIAWLDADAKVISRAAQNVTYTEDKCIAPDNAAYFIVNHKTVDATVSPYLIMGMFDYEKIDDITAQLSQPMNDAINGVFVVPENYIEQGAYSVNGLPINNPVSTTRIRTKFPVYVKSGSIVTVTVGSKCALIYWFFIKDSGEMETSGEWIESTIINIREDGYLLFSFRKANQSAIIPSDYDATIVAKTIIAKAVASIDSIDCEINLLHNLVNYGYDTPYDLAANPDVTTPSTIGVKRERNIFTLNTANAPSTDVRIKISGDMMRTNSFPVINGWEGISLINGHIYQVRAYHLSGSSTASTPNAISVYKQGEHASIGDSWVDGGVYYREFTYDGTPVSLAYFVVSGATYDNYNCLVILEDMSVEGAETSKTDNIVVDYNATISTDSQGANSGTKLKVVSYNVAAYDNDTAVHLPTEKEINFKKMLCEIAPDILAIQEDKRYVDSAGTRSALTSLYNPIFPYEYLETSGLQCTIRSKVSAATHDLLKYSNGRWLEIATYDINGKTLLFGSTHPVANYNSTGLESAESIAARLVQYQELVNWLNGTGTLIKINGGSAVYCPSYDWCVMCGDYNTITEDDKTNFKTTVETGGFKIANGDWLGWVETNYKFREQPLCLDNVIVSDNVIFDSIISHSGMFESLYSDHVPFEVTVTLQDV